MPETEPVGTVADEDVGEALSEDAIGYDPDSQPEDSKDPYDQDFDDADAEDSVESDSADKGEDESDSKDDDSDKAADDKVGEDKAEPKPAGPVFDDELTAMAAELGVPLAGFASVKAAEEKLLDVATARRQAETGAAPSESFKLEFDPDEYEPKLVEQIQKLNAHHENIARAQADEIRGLQNQVQSHTASAFEAKFDGSVSRLGAGYDELLGSGASADMDTSSVEYKNRENLAKQISLQLSLPNASWGKAFKTALNAVFGDKQQEIARKQVGDDVAKRDKQSLAKPTRRKTKASTSGVQAAIQAVNDKRREFNLD